MVVLYSLVTKYWRLKSDALGSILSDCCLFQISSETDILYSKHLTKSDKICSLDCSNSQGLIYVYIENALLFQLAVDCQLLLVMAPLIHIKTHWRELRYSSSVTWGLSQLGGQGQCVGQMGGGTLTQLDLYAQVKYF